MAKAVDVDGIRAAVNRNLNTTDATANELAAEAGISAGALSGFRNGNYKGRNDLVAEKLSHIIAERQAFAEITEGKRELIYFVRTDRFLKKTKSDKTMIAWMDKYPDAVGYVSWWSKAPEPMPFFKRWTREMSNETN